MCQGKSLGKTINFTSSNSHVFSVVEKFSVFFSDENRWQANMNIFCDYIVFPSAVRIASKCTYCVAAEQYALWLQQQSVVALEKLYINV